MKTFENIAQLTKEFWQKDLGQFDETDAALWQLRVQLAIAQQLSVIATSLKKIAERD